MIRYELDDRVATITMDDGKANALSPAMQQSIGDALDRADDDDAAVVLAGRAGRFSGGFDLAVMAEGGATAVDMVIGGFELSLRLLRRPLPTVAACTGHAMAMGAFLLLSTDDRVGSNGDYKIAANEVAIGMTVPHAPIELMRLRLTPAALQRSAVLAAAFDPASAVAAGYLDRLDSPDRVVTTAQELAAAHLGLDRRAHRDTKSRLREPAFVAIRSAIERDRSELTRLLT